MARHPALDQHPSAALKGWSPNGQLTSEQKEKTSLAAESQDTTAKTSPLPKVGASMSPRREVTFFPRRSGAQGSGGLSGAFWVLS